MCIYVLTKVKACMYISHFILIGCTPKTKQALSLLLLLLYIGEGFKDI